MIIHIDEYTLCFRMKPDSGESISQNTVGARKEFVHRYHAIIFGNTVMHMVLSIP